MKTRMKETLPRYLDSEGLVGKNKRVIFRILGVVALLCTVIVGIVYTHHYLASGNDKGEAYRYQPDTGVGERDSTEDTLSLLSLESEQAPKLFLTTATKSWDSAEANCQFHGGHLVSIRSSTDVQRVLNIGPDVWIGLHDRDVENQFKWSDGTPFIYANFGSGEPNNAGSQNNEDCVIQTPSGFWNDGTCSVLLQSVCEVYVVRTYFSAAKNWNDAESDCIAHGGHLASIHSSEENTAVLDLAGGVEVHIGYHDQDSENNFVWSNNIESSYTNWASNEPNDFNNIEDCAYQRTSGYWNDGSCSDTRGYVCEYPFPLDYVPGGSGWTNAEATCLSKGPGSHLVSIHSAAEQQVVKYFSGGVDVYLGFNDLSLEGTFMWSDGTSVDYTNWDAGEPNDANGDEDCAYMKSDGVWNDISCANQVNSVCKLSADIGHCSIEVYGMTAHLAFANGLYVHQGQYDDHPYYKHESINEYIYFIIPGQNNWDISSILGSNSVSGYCDDLAESPELISAEWHVHPYGDADYNVGTRCESCGYITVYGDLGHLDVLLNGVYEHQGTHNNHPYYGKGSIWMYWIGNKWGISNTLGMDSFYAYTQTQAPRPELVTEEWHVTPAPGKVNYNFGVRCESDKCVTGLADCGANTICENVPPSFKCTCKSGYTAAGDGISCVDIDECATGEDNCHANANCVNNAPGFSCTCKSGYAGNGFSCTDIDECATGDDNCDANALCVNTAGDFTCTCQSGYAGEGFSCTDIDECATGDDNCDANALCVNTAGDFTCTCQSGYVGAGFSCIDIDECATGADNCDANALCVNTAGDFTCTCQSGYAGDGFSCTDIDECATGADNCDANALCVNDVGDFTCTCKSGYAGSGFSCTDIDECATGADNCDANALCVNAIGGFTCTCQSGYAGNGVSCTNIDECETGADNCDANAHCEDTSPDFTCTCDCRYVGDGTTCSPDQYYTVKGIWINCYLGYEVLRSLSQDLPGAYMSAVSIATCRSLATQIGYDGFTAINRNGFMTCDFFTTTNFHPPSSLSACSVVAEADLASTPSPTSHIISDVCQFSYVFTGTSTHNSDGFLMWYLEGQLDIQDGQLASTSFVDFLWVSDRSLLRRTPLVGHWSQTGILLTVASGEGYTFTYEGPDVEELSETVVVWSTNEGGYSIERENGWDWILDIVAPVADDTKTSTSALGASFPGGTTSTGSSTPFGDTAGTGDTDDTGLFGASFDAGTSSTGDGVSLGDTGDTGLFGAPVDDGSNTLDGTGFDSSNPDTVDTDLFPTSLDGSTSNTGRFSTSLDGTGSDPSNADTVDNDLFSPSLDGSTSNTGFGTSLGDTTSNSGFSASVEDLQTDSNSATLTGTSK